jgi:DNA-binding beta-propeller fold protein YncE
VAPAPRPAGTSPAPTGGRLLGYAFNAGSQDVTLFDAGTRQALETRPLGATVRWLSNEQRFWDGRFIWTYDHPEDRVQVLAIDPKAVSVARTIDTARRGPAHSLMLTPDGGTAWVNAAGADRLVAVDLASGAVTGEVTTGAFP